MLCQLFAASLDMGGSGPIAKKKAYINLLQAYGSPWLYFYFLQDLSQLFKLLAYFETDISRKCQMHKRRVDMLSAELDELNPQHFLLVCRQLQYEIAETYR